MSNAPVRLQRLVIEELFGPGSPTIDIPFRLNERVTVLHGRNGSGKTITLRLLQAIREGQYHVLRDYPFRRIWLQMSDGGELEVAPPKTGNRSELFSFTLRRGDEKKAEKVKIQREDLVTKTASRILERIGLNQIGPDMWTSHEGDLISTSEALNIYRDMLPSSLTNEANEPTPLRDFRSQMPPVKLIRTDRLHLRTEERDPRRPPRPRRSNGLMVEHLSQNILALIKASDREYRLASTRLDASLPQRLFQPQAEVPSLTELHERSAALRTQEARLRDLGLLRESPAPVDEANLSDAQRSTFFIILRDREEKLAPFAQVVDKAERILQSLNRKLAPKHVRLDVEHGYRVLTADGRPLDLASLSSGEQHELVLLHELLFDVAPGSLILIDEPELSLHVTWQNDMLPELMEIARLSSLDFVLATHSGYIIGDHEALMVRLGDPA
jgi:predicted ATP-binding protein involved in virulence